MRKIVIIGGGLSGLTAAFRLQELKRAGKFDGEFLLLEAGKRLGGVIQTVERDGFLLELGADAFLSEKKAAVDLTKRLGIDDQLVPTNDENRRSFIVRDKRLRAVPAGFQLIAPSDVPAFFASELVSQKGKIRLANERFLLPAPPRTDETLASFVSRRFGNEALWRIAQPMIAGIYTANPEKLSLRATQPRFLELEQKYGSVIEGLIETAKQSKIQNSQSEIQASGARYSLFLSFKNGMQTLFDALASNIARDFLRLDALARTLSFNKAQRLWLITLENGEQITADAVCLALPVYRTAALLQNEYSELSKELAEIEYASTATVNLAFKRNQIAHELNGFGFVVPFIEKRTLMACTFSSVKFSGRAPEKHVLLRAFVGGALQHEMFELDDEAMTAGVLQDLRDLVGLTGKPLFAHISRWARSMPQYHLGHLQKVERINNLLALTPSLALATTAIDGVGIPDSVRHGETAAEKLTGFLSTKQFVRQSN